MPDAVANLARSTGALGLLACGLFPQYKAHGYDHNWVLVPAPAKDKLRLAAVLSDPSCDRVM